MCDQEWKRSVASRDSETGGQRQWTEHGLQQVLLKNNLSILLSSPQSNRPLNLPSHTLVPPWSWILELFSHCLQPHQEMLRHPQPPPISCLVSLTASSLRQRETKLVVLVSESWRSVQRCGMCVICGIQQHLFNISQVKILLWVTPSFSTK